MTPDISTAFEKRLAIYRQKHAQADPFADDTYNRREALAYVIEAIELLAVEAGVRLSELEVRA